MFERTPFISYLTNGRQRRSIWWVGAEALPSNVHLLNVRRTEEGLLVRLHHLFAVGEDSQLSRNVKVDLRKVRGGLVYIVVVILDDCT